MFLDNATMNGLLILWWILPFSDACEAFPRKHVNEPGEYPKPDEDDASRDALSLDPERHEYTLPSPPPPQKAVLFCPLPGQVHHLNWWLSKYFADHVDRFHMYAAMGNDECAEMPLKFQDSQNPTMFIMAPKVGRTRLNLATANHEAISQKFWELNEQWQANAHIVWIGRNNVPHILLPNMGPGDYDNHVSDLHRHSRVAQVRVLHVLMC